MNSNSLLKELLIQKMKIADEVINMLPQETKKHVTHVQRIFLLSLSEAVKEHICEQGKESEKEGVKTIVVE